MEEESISEEGISEATVIIPKKVFLHNVDDYRMNAILKQLQNEPDHYILFGSLSSVNANPELTKDNVVKDYLEDISECGNVGPDVDNLTSSYSCKCNDDIAYLNRYNSNYIEKIIDCDVMIYDIGVNNIQQASTDIPKILRALDEWSCNEKIDIGKRMERKFDECLSEIDTISDNIKSKFFILISTILTWADTRREKKEKTSSTSSSSSTSNMDKAVTVVDSKFTQRKPHVNFHKHRNLEQLVTCIQGECHPFVQTLILCPGVTYGGINNKLQYIFQKAFYNLQVPVFCPGTQLIPLIYLNDLTRMVKQIIDKCPNPSNQYIFAVQPDKLNLMDLTKNIVRGMKGSTSKCRLIQAEEMMCLSIEMFPQSLFDLLCVNLKINPTKLLQSFTYSSANNEQFWDQIAQEYRDANNVRPLKILIESQHMENVPEIDRLQIIELAKQLSDRYKLIYLDFSTIIPCLNERIGEIPIVDAKPDLNREMGELCEYNDNWLIDLIEICEDLRMDNTETAEEELGVGGFETVMSFLVKLLRSKALNKNQGYVACCLPLNKCNTKELFTKCPPTNYIQINTSDCTPNAFKVLDVLPINYYTTPERIVRLFTKICTDLGQEYAPGDKEEKALRCRKAEETRIKEQQRVEEMEKLAVKEHEEKLRKWSKEHEFAMQEQDRLSEIKSLPLRDYLIKYVIPIVTSGLLKVCEKRPPNPIDFLAEYLIQDNPHGKRVPSKCTETQRQRMQRNAFC